MFLEPGRLVLTRELDPRLIHHVDGVAVDVSPATSIDDAASGRAAALRITAATPIDPEALGRLADLRALYITGASLKAWWPGILALPQLEILVINGDVGVKALPPGIERLAALRQLELSATKVKALGPEVGALSRLDTLVLDGSPIGTLPAEIGALAALRALSLVGVPIKDLPADLANLTLLEELSAAYTKLAAFPDLVLSFPRLRLLTLGGDNASIGALPAGITALGALEKLRLAGVTSLPDAIGALRHLDDLYLGNGSLKQLPDSVGDLSRLRRLNVHGNKLKALPESIGQLQALEILTVSRNKLTALPQSTARLGALQKLEVQENPLTGLPDSLLSLPELRLVDLTLTGAVAQSSVANALRSKGVTIRPD